MHEFVPLYSPTHGEYNFQFFIEEALPILLSKDRQIFLVKSPVVNTLGFAGYIVSFTTNKFCHCSGNAAIDNM